MGKKAEKKLRPEEIEGTITFTGDLVNVVGIREVVVEALDSLRCYGTARATIKVNSPCVEEL